MQSSMPLVASPFCWGPVCLEHPSGDAVLGKGAAGLGRVSVTADGPIDLAACVDVVA